MKDYRTSSDLIRRAYYQVKPLLPSRVRWAIRRAYANHIVGRSKDIWPIDPSTGVCPEGWRGWPSSKTFALVLTHDVESAKGLARVKNVAEMEMDLGFRSSFNFVPEGEYEDPVEIRNWLLKHGFEVGVHDLRHDGRLFASRKKFGKSAKRINHYLREWRCSGFRAAFMLRELEWLHELEMAYDASTFDTDPFEPQPEGCGTIFPFPIVRSNGSSQTRYIELPYTLAQDSTLFILLRNKNAEPWRKKLDWVVKQGGMALLNTHPDYMRFSGESADNESYPCEFYRDFLLYLRDTYNGDFWHPLAKDVAEHVRGMYPIGCNVTEAKVGGNAFYKIDVDSGISMGGRVMQPVEVKSRSSDEESRPDGEVADNHVLEGKRVAVILYSGFPSDPRPRRAAEAMVKAGAKVEMICLKDEDCEKVREVVHGVDVTRISIKHHRNGKLLYLFRYAVFALIAGIKLTTRSLNDRYDLIHVHNMPDFLVFSAMVPKLLGAKIILDLHDPMPELMRSIYGFEEGCIWVRILKVIERCSLWFADSVITVNEACKRIFSSRSCRLDKVNVILNTPDPDIFKINCVIDGYDNVIDESRPFVMMYHGSLVERHGLDLAIKALERVQLDIPNAELLVYGKNTPYLQEVMSFVKESGIQGVRYMGSMTSERIVDAIRKCDVGLIPNRRSIFTEINTPTRILEYLSQGKPVIAPRAAGIMDYFDSNSLVLFELGDVDDLANKMVYVFRNPHEAALCAAQGQRIYLEYSWCKERNRLVSLAKSLLA